MPNQLHIAIDLNIFQISTLSKFELLPEAGHKNAATDSALDPACNYATLATSINN